MNAKKREQRRRARIRKREERLRVAFSTEVRTRQYYAGLTNQLRARLEDPARALKSRTGWHEIRKYLLDRLSADIVTRLQRDHPDLYRNLPLAALEAVCEGEVLNLHIGSYVSTMEWRIRLDPLDKDGQRVVVTASLPSLNFTAGFFPEQLDYWKATEAEAGKVPPP